MNWRRSDYWIKNNVSIVYLDYKIWGVYIFQTAPCLFVCFPDFSFTVQMKSNFVCYLFLFSFCYNLQMSYDIIACMCSPVCWMHSLLSRLWCFHSSVIDSLLFCICRYVLNVLASPLELDKTGAVRPYLLDTVFLDSTNFSTVAAAVIKTVTAFEISYEDIVVINTDNAAYMRKAYREVWKGLFPNSVHITCLAHVCNLFGDSFKKPFKAVTQFVKNINAMFWNAGARKMRFQAHLLATMPGQTPTMPPNPISTRYTYFTFSFVFFLSHFVLVTFTLVKWKYDFVLL